MNIQFLTFFIWYDLQKDLNSFLRFLFHHCHYTFNHNGIYFDFLGFFKVQKFDSAYWMMSFIKISSFNFDFNDLKKSFVDSYLIIVEFEWFLKQNIRFVLVSFLFLHNPSNIQKNAIFSVEIAFKSSNQLITLMYFVNTQ